MLLLYLLDVSLFYNFRLLYNKEVFVFKTESDGCRNKNRLTDDDSFARKLTYIVHLYSSFVNI